MDISHASLANPDHFTDQFLTWIKNNKESKDPVFLKFIPLYLTRFPLDEWLGRQFSDLYGLLFGLYHTLKNPLGEGASIKVFNPSLSEHGWQCGRTAIFVQQQDMPFLVDSVRIALNRMDIPVHIIKSTVLNVAREEKRITELVTGLAVVPKERFNKEALMYLEVSLQPSEQELSALKRRLIEVLADVTAVVDDHAVILRHLDNARDNIQKHHPQDKETLAFAAWLRHKHFVFLGYREYDLLEQQDGQALAEQIETRRGVFRRISTEKVLIKRSSFSEGMRSFYDSDDSICFSKAATHSSVHRSSYPDYVVIKKFNDKGEVSGEVRFLGLFTYEVFALSPFEIPIFRKKVNAIVEHSGIDPRSHDGKALWRTIENYPRAELMLTDVATLKNNILSIVDINERHIVRLISREDPFGNFVTCNVFIPKDVYSTGIRQKVQNILSSALNSSDLDFNTFFSESNLVRAQFVFKVELTQQLDIDWSELEQRISEETKNWDDNLLRSLVEALGESTGVSYYNAYKNGFTQSYQEHFDARYAVQDIQLLESLSSEQVISMNFYQPIGADGSSMRFRVLHLHQALVLSDVIPILENLGLRVMGEHPYQIFKKDGSCVWIHDFQLSLGLALDLDVHAVKNLFEQAFAAIWQKQAESDAFNKLVLGGRLNWREVCLLRAYAGYMKQIGFSADQSFIAETLVKHTEITRNLIAEFKTYFDPRLNRDNKSPERAERLQTKILAALDEVQNLNEDLVLRRYLDLINGTLRTNYFQSREGNPKDYISFKFSPRTIPDIPEPRPLFEIYVYSPRVEGVHLRGGKVARGGLRWSDRLQDYRTEVLGLVKAQQVKNAVIVPNGAKGGFVAKQPPQQGGRKAIFEEGVACYKIFIRGLLDLTDNLVDGETVPPENVVCRDEHDPYLVVAADKGTATFSDMANEISLSYNHWLGDAFASGGSQGYDHKGMGITAKGAWVSVQRHFREMGVDIQKEDFSVIGIGDMGGDVFGNGMLLSKHICLSAAFNHLHIFVDPNPSSAESFIERKRLFETPGSSWEDYNKALISSGGGVFSRAAKFIKLTPEIKACFDIKEDQLTPNAFIHALLKAPVDLIWNGGIGTYVKSESEQHSEAGDKANDCLRVNGSQLRCKVVGEGGNLGMTQLGRIEYCLSGGACNTDFIDNAAGVDCSDHEVNIKILLDELVASQDLTAKQRNTILADMTDEVSELVLQNNYRQTLAISIAQSQAGSRENEYRRFITYLENTGRLDRALEYLPSDEQILERYAHKKDLTRPELSVLISYAKVMMKEELIDSDIADDAYIAQAVETAFPKSLVDKYHAKINQHRLRREIVGTQIANDLINNLGITVGHRLIETTGASTSDIAKAYIVSRDVFEFEAFQHYIESLDHKVPTSLQAELMGNMVRRVRRGTRWFLRNRRLNLNPQQDVAYFREGMEVVYKSTAKSVEGAAREQWLARSRLFEEIQVPEDWALKLAMPDNLFSGLGVVESARNVGADTELVTDVFFTLLDRLDLNWFATQLSEVNVESYWQALARESYLDDLEAHLRQLTIDFVQQLGDDSGQDNVDKLVEDWADANQALIVRWKHMITEVQGSHSTDYAMFAVALRELQDLVDSTHYTHQQVE
ncbi:glutamate dehydrogenase (NAD) [Alteromonadaceae bacterium Bs31]|nr:glutamate dehydrogenase (NAD) [Alteromonadaceae bacterium Bs31]